jgi:2-polyprenyl-6-methoxyphenol hydroxylase-like FAD-dependent oxidoreductase
LHVLILENGMNNHAYPDTVDVLIAGAGAAGLVLALDLARRGVSFRLTDKLEAPFAGSRGKGIQPRTMEILEDLGVLDDLFANGDLYPPVHSYDGDKVNASAIHEQRMPTSAEPYVAALMVPQWRTEEILRAHLQAAGHAPEFGVELVGFTQDADGVTADLSTRSSAQQTPQAQQTQKVRARFLIGTDGGRSFVRRALDIDFLGESTPLRAIVADLRIDNLSRDAWHQWPKAEGGHLALCPLPGTETFQMTAQLAEGEEPDLSDDNIQNLIRQRSGKVDLVLHAPVWRSVFGVSVRLADRYRVGRVLIAGDAAHIHPPTGGQGLNTSIQDAYNLGWKLAAVVQGAPDALLDTYETERRPIAAGMLRMSMAYLKDMQEKRPMKRGRDTQQLDLTYRDSVLTQELRSEPGELQAGDRAPDAILRNAQGNAVRLFDILKGAHFTLLAFQSEIPAMHNQPSSFFNGVKVIAKTVRAADAEMVSDLADSENNLRDAFGLRPGELLLVRPDGYVAMVANANESETITDYLTRWLERKSHHAV